MPRGQANILQVQATEGTVQKYTFELFNNNGGATHMTEDYTLPDPTTTPYNHTSMFFEFEVRCKCFYIEFIFFPLQHLTDTSLSSVETVKVTATPLSALNAVQQLNVTVRTFQKEAFSTRFLLRWMR